MNELLTTLLHDDADRLDVPAPPAAEVLARGRRLARRRRGGLGLAAVTAAVVVVAGVVGVGSALSQGDERLGQDLAPAADSPLSTWAVASGSKVQLGDGAVVDVEGVVKSLYYTSAGVLVRTGAGPYTDAPHSNYVLIGADGGEDSFHLELGDRAPGTDPTLPYLAYATTTDDPLEWDVVLRDVRTGEVAQRIRVHGAFTWGGWVAPPVALSGDHLYVGLDAATLDVSWRTGDVTMSRVLPESSMPVVAAGRTVVDDSRVVDSQTGSQVARIPLRGAAMLMLSSDGGHALRLPWRNCDDQGSCIFDQPTSEVVDLATGTSVTVPLGDGVGWTPDGALVRVSGSTVDVCDPSTGECQSTPSQIGDHDLRIGGTSYEA
jgi:hypothetical protein